MCQEWLRESGACRTPAIFTDYTVNPRVDDFFASHQYLHLAAEQVLSRGPDSTAEANQSKGAGE